MLSGYLASRAPVKSAAFQVVRGTGKYAPLAGVVFFLGSMALAGLPPMNGFVSKLALFQSGITALQATTPEAALGYWLPLLLIGVAGILTVIYTMRALMRIWWEPFEPRTPEEKVKPYGDSLLAPASLVALCLVLGIWAQPLLHVAQDTSAWLAQPERYVASVNPEGRMR